MRPIDEGIKVRGNATIYIFTEQGPISKPVPHAIRSTRNFFLSYDNNEKSPF